MEGQNKFVIQHQGVAVVSIADVPAGAEYVGVIIDALRAGKQVGYQRGDLIEEIQVKQAPVKALKSAAAPAPIKRQKRRVKKTPVEKPAPVATVAKRELVLMARNMSFMLTTQQVLTGTKDVTRRLGWWNLRPGDQLNAVEKGMGLKRGQKIVKLRRIEVVSIRHERLDAITPEDVVREGFPEITPLQFIEMFCQTHKGCTPATLVNRIEFKYL